MSFEYMKQTNKINKGILSCNLQTIITNLISITSKDELYDFINKYNLDLDVDMDDSFEVLRDKVAFELTEMIFKERDDYYINKKDE